MKNLRNLRNRPFLVVDVWYKPARFARTERKGWGNDSAAWDVQEHPRLVNRISDKTMAQATLIIDVNARTAIKNRFNQNGTEDAASEQEIVDHFLKVYDSYLPKGETSLTTEASEVIETTGA